MYCVYLFLFIIFYSSEAQISPRTDPSLGDEWIGPLPEWKWVTNDFGAKGIPSSSLHSSSFFVHVDTSSISPSSVPLLSLLRPVSFPPLLSSFHSLISLQVMVSQMTQQQSKQPSILQPTMNSSTFLLEHTSSRDPSR